jgi:hypothetical protein
MIYVASFIFVAGLARVLFALRETDDPDDREW